MTNKKNTSPANITLSKVDKMEKHYDANIEKDIKRDQAIKYNSKPSEVKKIKHVYLTHDECQDLAFIKIKSGRSEKDLLSDFVTKEIKAYKRLYNIS